MKTVRHLPKSPREESRSIVHPSCEEYFPTEFHHFYAKYAKQQKHYDSAICYQYCIKTLREVPGRPHEGPKTVVQSSGKKYFSAKFHHFCAKYFSSFRNFPPTVLDTVMSPRAYTLRNPFIIYKRPTKNN